MSKTIRTIIPLYTAGELIQKADKLKPIHTNDSTHIIADSYIIDGKLYEFMFSSDGLCEISEISYPVNPITGATETGKLTLFWHGMFSNWAATPFIASIPTSIIPFAGKLAHWFSSMKMEFSTSEQYMMFCKAVVFNDFAAASRIMMTTNPKEQKKIGREIKNFSDEVWNQHRMNVMIAGCYAKFSQNDRLRDQLLATGNTILCEASPVDRIWGIGYAQDNPRAYFPELWDGLNLLGEALVKVREKLRTRPCVNTSHAGWMTVGKKVPSVALMVGRFQPLHRAHCMLIERMIQDNDVAIVCVGSAQERGTERNPFSVDVRMAMLKNVFGDRIKIVPIKDLGTGIETGEWIANVIGKCMELNLPEPNRYYCGCHDDALWYKNHFAGNNAIKTIEGDLEVYKHSLEKRELIICERTLNHFPSATRIREYINLRMHDWMPWIPEVNHVIVEANYPQEMRNAVTIESLDANYPHGTFAKLKNEDQIYQNINGRWNPARQSISLVY